MIDNSIKLTLKAARINQGLTQKEAGKALGLSEYVIANWEHGRTFPNAIQLKKLEQIYHVPYDNLIFLQK